MTIDGKTTKNDMISPWGALDLAVPLLTQAIWGRKGILFATPLSRLGAGIASPYADVPLASTGFVRELAREIWSGCASLGTRYFCFLAPMFHYTSHEGLDPLGVQPLASKSIASCYPR